MTAVEVQLRHVYGKPLIYPMNEPARLFAELCGRKTILETDLKKIVQLGFRIEWIPESVEVKSGN